MDKSTAETVVKVYAIIAWIGALVAVIGAVALFVGGSFLSVLVPAGTTAARTGVIGALSLGIGIFLLAFAVFNIFVGYGLWTHRPWARIAVIIMSVIDLFSFPIGTIIGIIGIWLFGFDDTVKSLFDAGTTHAATMPTASRRAK